MSECVISDCSKTPVVSFRWPYWPGPSENYPDPWVLSCEVHREDFLMMWKKQPLFDVKPLSEPTQEDVNWDE